MFDLLDGPCHTLGIVSYTIIPRGRGYWINSHRQRPARARPIERFDTEDMAVQRLRVLQANAATVERQKDILLPKKRR